MYNRYVPQADGSYRRNRMPDKIPTQEQATRPAPPEPPPGPPPERKKRPPQPKNPGLDGFLKNLLPGDFDTGDLLVILLLLLMAGDSPEGRSNALLTVAMYFLM